MGNFNSKENDKYKTVVRSGSLYYEIMEVLKLQEKCRKLSGEVKTYYWSKEEVDKHIERWN